MDNQKELLAELERGLSELKEKIAVMEKLIAEYNRTETSDSEENGEVAEHIELVHEDFLPEISEAVQEETAPGIIAVEERSAEAVPEESQPEIPAASETAVGDLPAAEEEAPESVFGELWGESKPAPAKKPAPRTLNDVNAASVHKAVIDSRPDKPRWYTDIPGSEVKDVRSAISLNDRVLFICSLFRDDSMLFQDVVNRINSFPTLEKAVEYLSETFPEWDIYSDNVHRFMMAVRRKIRQNS
ncbi:MAG: hypothetical protein EGS78_09315 [Bacteroidales bacterium]|nr:hypothetical protein [Bacteroidales bacterium]